MTPKAQATKEKIKLNFIKIKNVGAIKSIKKVLFKKMKRQLLCEKEFVWSLSQVPGTELLKPLEFPEQPHD